MSFPNLPSPVALALSVALAASLASASRSDAATPPSQPHVLVLSIDGMHQLDLANYLRSNPASALKQLANTGVEYTSANTVRPSDSFPTFLALFTGGSPASTGVYYDDSYDRSLWPPGSATGTAGTAVTFTEVVDFNSAALDGGGGINPASLPRDPARGGAPVWPHDYLRVNTVFEVVKAAGGRTALCEKHLSYEIANGPSGTGVDDLFTPEIAANNVYGTSITKSVLATEDYDDLKVAAVLAQIAGYEHTSNTVVGVPSLFGMNFQALSVAQKLKSSVDVKGKSQAGAGGYIDGAGTPGLWVAHALSHTDASIARILSALQQKGLLDSTYVVLVGKHGNSPMDPSRLNVASTVDYSAVLAASGITVAKVTADDVGLIWLQDASQTDLAVNTLRATAVTTFAQDIYAGEALKNYWSDPATDSRTPDIILFPRAGTIYTTSSKKIAEHGGASEEDTHVALIVSNPHISPAVIKTAVNTAQVAPTLLQLLGLSPFSLQAVVLERTPVLPSFEPLQVAAASPLPVGQLGFNPVSIGYSSLGVRGLQLSELSARHYLLEGSIDLVHWVPLSTNSLTLQATVSLGDAQSTSLSNRFYRAVSLP